MWRPTYTFLRKVVTTPYREKFNFPMMLYSSKSRPPRSTSRLTLISAGVGILVGAGYGGYTHYKVNMKKSLAPIENEEYAFLKVLPEYQPQYKVSGLSDSTDLHLVLFQYRTCPFCCKVRAYLDARGISYEIVEVDAVLRQAIKWSGYKKVPILLAKVEGGYQQLLDSTAIISILETYLRDTSTKLRDIIKFYPVTRYQNDTGRETRDITNKYFIMHNEAVIDDREKKAENEERAWRQWADKVLVHTLSPNVYQTASEALETFRWFEEAGAWKKSFPSWECNLMVYGGAAAMWIIAKRLKSRHNIKGDPRESLYDAANEWMAAIKKKGTKFFGGDQPNLADISVYGVLSSIEGCRAFKDLRNNTQIGSWYDDIKKSIEHRRGDLVATFH